MNENGNQEKTCKTAIGKKKKRKKEQKKNKKEEKGQKKSLAFLLYY